MFTVAELLVGEVVAAALVYQATRYLVECRGFKWVHACRHQLLTFVA